MYLQKKLALSFSFPPHILTYFILIILTMSTLFLLTLTVFFFLSFSLLRLLSPFSFFFVSFSLFILYPVQLAYMLIGGACASIFLNTHRNTNTQNDSILYYHWLIVIKTLFFGEIVIWKSLEYDDDKKHETISTGISLIGRPIQDKRECTWCNI